MRKALLLMVWLLGIVFPAAWVGQFSTAYRGVFGFIFGPEWTHVCMHLFIYAVLSVLIFAVVKRTAGPMLKPGWLWAFGLAAAVLAVGVLQESLQWVSQGVVPWQGVALAASLYDLGVDLSGGLLGMGVVYLWRVSHPV